eukprot:m.1057139 g.1057139  ORF g.1057139 m.1057139 type:complete len:229 (-) comp24205_c0_seq5:1256-1942(-)
MVTTAASRVGVVAFGGTGVVLQHVVQLRAEVGALLTEIGNDGRVRHACRLVLPHHRRQLAQACLLPLAVLELFRLPHVRRLHRTRHPGSRAGDLRLCRLRATHGSIGVLSTAVRASKRPTTTTTPSKQPKQTISINQATMDTPVRVPVVSGRLPHSDTTGTRSPCTVPAPCRQAHVSLLLLAPSTPVHSSALCSGPASVAAPIRRATMRTHSSTDNTSRCALEWHCCE